MTYTLPGWADPTIAPEPARCRSCGDEIGWVVSHVSRRKAPINPDGTSHFATCPQADKWRKAK